MNKAKFYQYISERRKQTEGKDGILEEWKDGRMERWKSGMMECWNDGKKGVKYGIRFLLHYLKLYGTLQ